MEAVKLALQGFVSRNGRLPCPGVENLTPSDANYGIEDMRTTNPATSCTNTVALAGGTGIDAAKRGVVPWKSLGLIADAATDARTFKRFNVTQIPGRVPSTIPNVPDR